VTAVLAALLAALLGAPLQSEDVARELVGRIQRDLSEVDRRLEQAADDEEPGEALESTRAAHVRAIADLEELIHQFKYHRGEGS
jgi:hypothetical protein